jgi:hypothetical protein
VVLAVAVLVLLELVAVVEQQVVLAVAVLVVLAAPEEITL